MAPTPRSPRALGSAPACLRLQVRPQGHKVERPPAPAFAMIRDHLLDLAHGVDPAGALLLARLVAAPGPELLPKQTERRALRSVHRNRRMQEESLGLRRSDRATCLRSSPPQGGIPCFSLIRSCQPTPRPGDALKCCSAEPWTCGVRDLNIVEPRSQCRFQWCSKSPPVGSKHGAGGALSTLPQYPTMVSVDRRI